MLLNFPVQDRSRTKYTKQGTSTKSRHKLGNLIAFLFPPSFKLLLGRRGERDKLPVINIYLNTISKGSTHWLFALDLSTAKGNWIPVYSDLSVSTEAQYVDMIHYRRDRLCKSSLRKEQGQSSPRKVFFVSSLSSRKR